MKTTNRKIIPIAALFAANGLVYGLNALYYCFIQIYLEQYHTPVNVGILLSIGPLVSIFAPLFWGMSADRAKYKNNVLTLTVAGSAVFYVALMFSQNFIYLFIMLILLMFFMSPFGGLIDTITLEYTADSGFPYGPIRVLGTIVYGAIPMVLSIFTDTNIFVIFYAYAAVAVLSILALLIMPKVEGHAQKSERINILPIFKDWRLVVIFVMIAVSHFSWGYYTNFYPSYITDGLGLSQTVWGINVFVTVLGEIPFFLMFTGIFKRFGVKKVLFISLVLSVLRYGLLAIVTGSVGILVTGLVTGASVTMITYCGSVYINENVAPAMKASGQTIMYALCYGIPKVLAGVFGGMMTDSLGVPMSMFLCTGLSVAALVLFFAVFLRDQSPSLLPEKKER